MYLYSDSDPILSITRALGCQTRLHVLRVVGAFPDGLRVVEVARGVGIAESTAHHHLAHLLKVGLIKKTRKGAWSRYCLADTRYYLAIETAS